MLCDRSAFVGSTAEDEQFDALHAQVGKVMAAAREFLPYDGPADACPATLRAECPRRPAAVGGRR